MFTKKKKVNIVEEPLEATITDDLKSPGNEVIENATQGATMPCPETCTFLGCISDCCHNQGDKHERHRCRMHLNNPEPEDVDNNLLESTSVFDDDDEVYSVRPKQQTRQRLYNRIQQVILALENHEPIRYEPLPIKQEQAKVDENHVWWTSELHQPHSSKELEVVQKVDKIPKTFVQIW